MGSNFDIFTAFARKGIHFRYHNNEISSGA